MHLISAPQLFKYFVYDWGLTHSFSLVVTRLSIIWHCSFIYYFYYETNKHREMRKIFLLEDLQNLKF